MSKSDTKRKRLDHLILPVVILLFACGGLAVIAALTGLAFPLLIIAVVAIISYHLMIRFPPAK
jgi:uncharacterized ion transporter superfamily protein YfcC